MVNDQLLLESVNQARYDVRGLIEAIKNNKIMTSGEVTWESFGVLQHVRKSLIDAIKVSEGDQVNLEQLISENQPKPKKSYYKPRKKAIINREKKLKLRKERSKLRKERSKLRRRNKFK